MVRPVAIAGLLTAASACGYQGPCPEGEGSVLHIELISSDGGEVPFGVVRTVHQTGALNECMPFDGSLFACGPLKAGVWTIHAAAPGYQPQQFALELTGASACGEPEVVVQLQMSGAPTEAPNDGMESDLKQFGRCSGLLWASDAAGNVVAEFAVAGNLTGSNVYDLEEEEGLFTVRTGAFVTPQCDLPVTEIGFQTWVATAGTLTMTVERSFPLGDGRDIYNWHARAESVLLEERTEAISAQIIALDVYGAAAY